jgi:hypothetical protein
MRETVLRAARLSALIDRTVICGLQSATIGASGIASAIGTPGRSS